MGIMLFFSFVVAPVVDAATLNEGKLLEVYKKIFPYYYNVNYWNKFYSFIEINFR